VSRDRHQQDDPSGRRLPPRLDPRAGRPPRSRTGSGSASASDLSHEPGQTPRTRGRRAATAVRAAAGLLSAVLLASSGWGWYLGQVADASVNRTDAIPTDGNVGSGNGAAMNLLLVGNDSRASATEEQREQLSTGDNSGVNTDTMILVHVPADGSRASFVSFPRDSYVEIPGYGRDKLNAAYSYGYHDEAGEGATDAQRQSAGAQLLIQTISQLSGLQIDHYAEVDLLGFFNLSSVVGGVEVNLCAPARDKFSGADLPAGVQTISGEQALAFVRQRHGLPRGDFDRIVRQQTFIAGMIRKMLSDNVLLDPGKQRELVEAAAGSLTVDNSLDLFGLAGQMQSVTAGSIEFQTIPYVGDDEDEQGRYILRLEEADVLHEFFAQLSADPEPTPAAAPTTEAPETAAPSAVTVEVYNGSGTSGLAAEAAAGLGAAGFAVASTGNADSSGYETTEIRHAAGDEALARALAAAIPGARAVESGAAASGTVQLVLGTDFTAVGEAVTAPAPETTTEGGTDEVESEEPRTAADTGCIN
jgi:LCP family protein required for cell wall assembly